MVDPIADIASILAVLLAGLAAFYAIRGDLFSRESHTLDIEPRVRLAAQQGNHYELGNAGGAAPIVLILIEEPNGRVSVVGYTGLPAMATAVPTSVQTLIGQKAATGHAKHAILITASDVERRWWDCSASTRIENFGPWWAAQLQAFGLPAWTVTEHASGLAYTLNPP